jgi:hypothetical protein
MAGIPRPGSASAGAQVSSYGSWSFRNGGLGAADPEVGRIRPKKRRIFLRRDMPSAWVSIIHSRVEDRIEVQTGWRGRPEPPAAKPRRNNSWPDDGDRPWNSWGSPWAFGVRARALGNRPYRSTRAGKLPLARNCRPASRPDSPRRKRSIPQSRNTPENFAPLFES